MAAPRILSSAFITLCSAFFFLLLSLGFSTLVPYYLQLRGADELLYGLSAGMHGVGGVLAMLLFSGRADQLSRRTGVLLYGAPAGVGALIMLVAVEAHPFWYLLALGLFGLMLGAALPLMFIWAADLSPPERRTEAFAWFGIAGLIADSLGPFLGEALLLVEGPQPTPASFRLVYLAAALLLLPAAACLVLTPEGRSAVAGSDEVESAGVRRLWSSGPVRLTLLAAVTFGGALGVMIGLGKNFVVSIGLTFVGPLLGGYTIGAIVVRVALPFVLSRFDRSRLPPLAFGGVTASMLLLAAAGGYGLLLVAGVVYGVSHGLLFPTLLSRLVDYGGLPAAGRLSTLYLGMYCLGQGVIPAIGGVILRLTSFQVLFLWMALVSLLGVVLTRRAEQQHAALLAEPS